MNFSTIDKRVSFPNQNGLSGKTLSSEYYGSKRVDDDVFLSLSSALVWLDARAYEVDGNLQIISEPILFWEVYEDFLSLDNTDFGAHMGDDYEAAGNTIINTIFWDNLFSLVNISETASKLIPIGDGYSYYTKETYADCLYSMGVNNPLENEAIKHIFTATN